MKFAALPLSMSAVALCLFTRAAGQEITPGPYPQLFAPVLVSGENPEFGAALSPDGSRFWFNRTNADRSKMTLMESRKEKNSWSPAFMPAFADSTQRDIDPSISPDGELLTFSSSRPMPGTERKDFNLWFVRDGEEKPQPFPESVNSPEDEVFCSMSREKNLYFARFLGKKFRIFVSQYRDGRYQDAQMLQIPGTDSASISNPAISPDENYLIFASGQLGGFGAADLWVSKRSAEGDWTAPQNLGPGINSADTEFAPSFSTDAQWLFFTSERPGVVGLFPAGKRRPGDIYVVSIAEHLEKCFASPFPKVKIPQDPENLQRLAEINRDIWTPFSAAYASFDADKYLGLHSKDFIRGTVNETRNLDQYAEHVRRQFKRSRESGGKVQIDFSFFERVSSPESASERGIYRYAFTPSGAETQYYYGRFHVFHRKIQGKWKIVVDYDSDEDNSIGEADFKAGWETGRLKK